MTNRQPIQKKIRFDVFKRDLFVCQYCGATPPSVVLEVDHIDPVSNGGTNTIHNLITACFDCNRGKSDRLLSDLPDSLIKRADVLAEKEAQIKAFNLLIKKQRKREEKDVDSVQAVFQETYSNKQFSPQFRASIHRFLSKLHVQVLHDAMYRACSKTHNSESATKYFCGICWHIIKGN
jgi:hypothetical protein